ncbi:MAG: hypothetical protein JXR40_12995 [Pontiellaceae bacterium]|nr:hypothetical protein [Pontiellaceae bacterium]
MDKTGGMKDTDSILIGNAYPLSLVRRPVRIEPVAVDELRAAARGRVVVSFWGHANTLVDAEKFTGLPLAPREERPVIHLHESGLPSCVGRTFCECWILSPDYTRNLRPAVGEEVPVEHIGGWTVLKITWE